ncbi:MAG TPA: hypothetical protein DCW90_02455 [Lachnospiraceae bacterium]|nr:hypothetical protein [Lachnospiraceae bacterium]
MTLSNVIFMGLVLGLIGMAITGLFFCLFYFLIYKCVLKGEKQISAGRVFSYIFFITYIFIVAAATIILRKNHNDVKRMSLQPFIQYRSAWFSCSMGEWRNIILNIIMFIPFGFMIPWLFAKLRSVWKVTVISFAISLLIESVQFFTRCGIFETDDLIHNTLGALIGSCIYQMFYDFVVKKKVWFGKIVLRLIPTLLTVAVFAGFYIHYKRMEFGIMSQTYILKTNMSQINIKNQVKLSEKRPKANIYKTAGRANADEMNAFAEKFMDNINVTIDTDKTRKLDNLLYMYGKTSEDREVCLGVNSLALTYSYEEYSDTKNKRKEIGQKELREKLKKLSIKIPEDAKFIEKENGDRFFETGIQVDGTMNLFGWIECSYYDDNTMAINNHIVNCKPVKCVSIISEKEAFEQIKQGKFRSENKIDSLTILDVMISYAMDSKGYLQPVYKFEVLLNGENEEITIQAYQKH